MPVPSETKLVGVDDATAEALLRCYYLADFMSEYVVEDKYKPPMPLVAAISLTAKGKTLAGHAKGEGVVLMESQLASFLTMWAGDELLVDPRETDLEALRVNLGSEIKRRKIKYPWIFGRQFYDAVADSTFHGDAHPSHEETVRLVDHLPQGVFQLGPYVSGPYGLIESRQWRRIPPSLSIPAYHCAEIDCDIVHSVHLSTGESGVRKAREVVRRRIAKIHKQETHYQDAVLKLESRRIPPFAWSQPSSLQFFLFDSFRRADINLLLEQILESGTMRAECAQLGLTIGRASEFAEKLTDAELLQVLLLANDRDIHCNLNSLVWARTVKIPPGELRSAQVISRGFGPLGIKLQASSLGVRYGPPSGLVQLRLRQLINVCFPSDNEERQAALRWLLSLSEQPAGDVG